MANPNPYQARLARYRAERADPLEFFEVRQMLSGGLREVEAVMLQAPEDNPELKLKAAHALSQLAGQYTKLSEVGTLDDRMNAMEHAVDQILRGRAA